MKKISAVIILLFFLISAAGVNASAMEEPTKSFSLKIDKVIEILKAQKNSQIEKEKAKKEIWNIVNGVFDFRTISMRTVGRPWKEFSEQEQTDFVDAFSELLGTSYLSRIESYNDETITYLSQEIQEADKAVIKTAIIRKNGNVPLEYNVLKKNSDWFIYDVKVEGISLVKNYRTQFSSFLAKKKPADLIKRLREKNIEIKTKGQPKSPDKDTL